jgi:indolepyruvate ferredoxin oxidoreductase, alpha subunit
MATPKVSGSEALAFGALDAGVQFVTGYPGSPSTATLEALLRLQAKRRGDSVRVEWAINEKSAFDTAFGASLAGIRSLLCLKSVGLNVALDSLMVANLAAGDGGFVILTGDDPGGWGSQNEEDSRPLAAAAEVPLLEPTTVADARPTMRRAFDLSERFQVPVVVRITQALAAGRAELGLPPAVMSARRAGRFERGSDRFNVLPIHVVDYHRRLQATIKQIQAEFEASSWNTEQGNGRAGILAVGYAYQKLAQLLQSTPPRSGAEGAASLAVANSGQHPLRILSLSSLYPLPATRIAAFLRQVDQALVLEEIAPYVETQVQAIAQRAGLPTPILGRSSDHLPGAGELTAHDIAAALNALLPNWERPSPESVGRTMPSRQPLCDDCPYIPMADALLAAMDRHGGREAFVVTGETGCIVRAQLPPWELLDVKYAMGSSIGLATGLARADLPEKIVALTGDSAFLHSGLGELIDAVQAGANLLVVILDNETTALSGGQPHPATGYDALGQARKPVDLVALVRASGVDTIWVVDPADMPVAQAAFEEGLTLGRLGVVITRHPCPRWVGQTHSGSSW